jgi:hypothetical protein
MDGERESVQEDVEEAPFEETIFINNHGRLWFRVDDPYGDAVVLLGTSTSNDEFPGHWLQLSRDVQARLRDLLNDVLNDDDLGL